MTLKQWTREHPGQAVLRALWVIFNFAFGAASAGFLAWGPLGAGGPAMVDLGLLGGLIAGGVWARQQIAAALGQTEVARRWRRRLLLATAAIFAFTEKIEGEAVVTWSSLAGEAVGLTRGAVIQSVGRMSVEERIAYLEELDPRIVSGSTARQREARGYLNLLRIPADESVEVTFEAPDGEERTAALCWDEAPENPYANLERTVTSERLASGVGVIRIPTFDRGAEGDPVSDFDGALDGMMDAPGLVIDLRGNGGGASFVAEPMAGRLVMETVVYAHERYRARLPRFGWRIASARPRSAPGGRPTPARWSSSSTRSI